MRRFRGSRETSCVRRRIRDRRGSDRPVGSRGKDPRARGGSARRRDARLPGPWDFRNHRSPAGKGSRACAAALSPSHILLDDAFQNFSVAKDVDVLLLDAERPFGGGRLLPLGTLREYPRGARRADVIIFTRARDKWIPEAAREYVEGKRVYFGDHEPSPDLSTGAENRFRSSFSPAKNAFSFPASPAPGSFERTILALGAKPRAAFRFVDHHRYVHEDVRLMLKEGGSDALFVTTEKDRAKAIELSRPGPPSWRCASR